MNGLVHGTILLPDARQIAARPDHHAVETVIDACDVLVTWGDWIDVARGTALAAAIRREQVQSAGLAAIDQGLAELEAHFVRIARRSATLLWIAAAATLIGLAVLVTSPRGAAPAPSTDRPEPTRHERQSGVQYVQAE